MNCHSPRTSLENLTYDCLLFITPYLNVFETVNMASTCKSLYKFAIDCIFPRLARKIVILMLAKADDYYNRDNVLDDILELKKPFKIFGGFVEEITLVGSEECEGDERLRIDVLRSLEKVLELCPNLRKLCFKYIDFKPADIHILQYVSTSIKDLKCIRCTGITSDWACALKKLPLERITLTGQNENNGKMFGKINTLSDLTIASASTTTQGLQTIFKRNGHSLKSLKLIDFFDESPDCASVIATIPFELPKLENLAIEDVLSTQLLRALTVLPNLKCLHINCCGSSVNALLKTLSNQGSIEDLELHNSVIDNEDNNASPLMFSKLKTLVGSRPTSAQFLKLINKSQMPVITSLTLFFKTINNYEHEILSVFKSKKSLKSLKIEHWGQNDSSLIALLCGIVTILEVESDRPFLKLTITRLKLCERGVS